ncbi:MAG: hypothetical protein ACRYGP_33145 [Janthinobacterium lividum]
MLRAEMEAYLAQFAGRRALVIPNPGNAGDALIALGTYRALTQARIAWRVAQPHEVMPGDLVFVIAGGSLASPGARVADVLGRVQESAGLLVLLPATVRGYERELAELGSRCVVFCRDAESLRHVRLRATRASVLAGHDMAFHVSSRDGSRCRDGRANADEASEELLKASRLDLRSIRSRETADFSKAHLIDGHRPNPPPIDVAELFTFAGGDLDEALSVSRCLLRVIRSAKAIVTDRLHVAIASTLSARRCELRSDPTGKNLAVFEASLARFAPLVRFSNGVANRSSDAEK